MSCHVCGRHGKLLLQSKRSTMPAGPAKKKKKNDSGGTCLSVGPHLFEELKGLHVSILGAAKLREPPWASETR